MIRTLLSAAALAVLCFAPQTGEALELRPDGAYCLSSSPIMGEHPSVERVSAHSCAYDETASANAGQQWRFNGSKIMTLGGDCLQEVDALGGGYKLVVHECAPYRGQNFRVEGARILTNSGNCLTFDGRSGTMGMVSVSACGQGGSQVLNLKDDFKMGGGGQIVGYP